MRIVEAVLESASPYSQSRYIREKKKERETDPAFEERIWRERCHANRDGYIFIPPMAFANSLKEAAKYLSIPVPGQGSTKFTKNFESGVMVLEPLVLPMKKDEVQGEWLFVPSDGKRGGGKRVLKCFPHIPDWRGTVTFYILDDIITEEVFVRVLKATGSLIGIGRFRPRNWGFYGRFKIVSYEWLEVEQ